MKESELFISQLPKLTINTIIKAFFMNLIDQLKEIYFNLKGLHIKKNGTKNGAHNYLFCVYSPDILYQGVA